MTPLMVDLYPPVSALYAYETKPAKPVLTLTPQQLVCRSVGLVAPKQEATT